MIHKITLELAKEFKYVIVVTGFHLKNVTLIQITQTLQFIELYVVTNFWVDDNKLKFRLPKIKMADLI